MAATKAIRTRANNKTKLAALQLDEAIAQSKVRAAARQHRGGEHARKDIEKLKERLRSQVLTQRIRLGSAGVEGDVVR